MIAPNAAVFYDMEYLSHNYEVDLSYTNFSFKDLRDEIDRKIESYGNVAMQRAYAQWGDDTLRTLRKSIFGYGIEPIQLFGLKNGQQNRIIDNQIILDAIDIAYSNVNIQVFVIVSGDGGYAPLVSRLLSKGKIVVVCDFKSNKGSAIDNLKALVGINYIEIPDLAYEIDGEEQIAVSTFNTRDKLLIEPNLKVLETNFLNKIKPFLDKDGREAIIKHAQDLLNMIRNEGSIFNMKNGIPFVRLKPFFDKAFPNIDKNLITVKVTKFKDFMRLVTNGTEYAVYSLPPYDVKIGLRNFQLPNHTLEDDFTVKETHSAENYRSILKYGTPVLRPPYWTIQQMVCQQLENEPAKTESLGELIDRISTSLYDLPTDEIKNALLALVSSDCFIRTPAEVKTLKDQKLSQKEKLGSAAQLLTQLESVMKNKIEAKIGESCNQDFFEECKWLNDEDID